MPDTSVALRARTIIPLTGEKAARGAALRAPLRKLDNGLILIRNGQVAALGTAKELSLPANVPVRDLGDVCLLPACINAHCHVQLSFLKGKTRWGAGFTAWLQSLIPLLFKATPEEVTAHICTACAALAAAGHSHLGDITGSLAIGMDLVDQLCRAEGMEVCHFCEWFGFALPPAHADSPWPPRCRQNVHSLPATAYLAPAGHALYSTAPELLQHAHSYCCRHGRTFSFHLAESPDETRLLCSGDGPLFELYRGTVLPAAWQAPGLRPLAYARKLGLLTQETLAVHGTQLESTEIDQLARSGASLCLCPRSNHYLGVGQPRVQELLQSAVLLCLGTDGLTSNTDLDVRQEALWLREKHDVPFAALVRMFTVNAAAALRVGGHAGQLSVGGPARFCLWPEELA